MQKGQLIKRHGAWHLRYWRAGKRICQRLAPFNDTFRTEKSVRGLVNEILQPLNEGRQTAGPQTLQNFIDVTYLPYAKEHKRPSTYRGYKNLYKRHIAPRIADIKMWQFRTVDCQRLIDGIASEVGLSKRSLFNIKTFLSAAFSHAIRMGVLDGSNPVKEVSVPKGRPTEPTHAYSLVEVKEILATLNGTAHTAVTVAAWTGLSVAELRGLQWADVEADQITVRRTCWNKVVGPTKTDARNAPVPLLPVVTKALSAHHKRNPHTTWIFEGPFQFPLDLAQLGSKSIAVTLTKAGLKWHGWHALRRGFATNLHDAGVPDKTIQSLLRHSSLAVTMGYYVKTLPEQSRAAVQLLGKMEKAKKT